MNVRAAFRQPWLGPLVALLVVYALFAAAKPDTFAATGVLVAMARETVVVGIAAVGTSMVIASGGIDLSIGSAVALTTVVVASSLRAGHGAVHASIVGIGCAAACGAIIGLLVTRLRVTPFIVTLGAMTILRGAAKGVANEQKIDADPHGLDVLLSPIAGGGFPPGVWTMLVVAIAIAVVLRSTRFGRHVLAIGSNEATALLCGIRVDRTKVLVYTLAAAFSGLAGVMEFSRLTVGDPTVAIGLELEVIAAVVIGGGSLLGGEASVAGSLVGAFLMTVITTGCTHVGLPNWVEEIVAGAIIVVAVALDRIRQARRS